jgi:hypothetical protein
VLPRQAGDDAIEREPLGFHFGLRVGDAHAMCRRNRDRRVFFAVLHQHEPSVGLERSADAPQHLLRMLKLVIDVDEKRQIDAFSRQHRIDVRSEHHRDVVELPGLRFLLHDLQHRRLNVFGIDLPRRSDQTGDAGRHVSGAGANVGDDHPRPQTDQHQRLFRRLLLLPRRAIEPVRVGRDAGDLQTCVQRRDAQQGDQQGKTRAVHVNSPPAGLPGRPPRSPACLEQG